MSAAPAAVCSAEANLQAALVLLRAFQGCGLRRLVLCPGSRSAPLAVAAGLLAEGGGLELYTSVDERSAAFLAVGLGRGDGTPTAVVTTSGSAVANLLPAVVEADSGALPLLLLSADRPTRLKGRGANQTVNQEAFLAPCCRRALSGDPRGLAAMGAAALSQLAVEAWQGCLGQPRGPVHCNLPFEEPLHVGPADLEAVAPRLAAPPPPPAAAVACTDAPVPRCLDPDSPGVVVAGPWRGTAAALEPFAQALIRWQRRSGWPVLADGLSGLRGWPGLDLIHSYDLLLEPGHGVPPAPQLLRLGPMPASRRLQQWIAGCPGPQLLISEADPRNLDGGLPVHARWGSGLVAWEAARSSEPLAETGPQPRPASASLALAARWRQLDGTAQALLDARLTSATTATATTPPAAAPTPEPGGSGPGGGLNEPALARALSRALPPGLPLMLASSSPVRDWESFAAADACQRPVIGFRGASGIDGTLSLAAGLACSAGRLLLYSGDLALLHDANGWLWHRQLAARGARLTVVVVDNGGGGIFEQLPIRPDASPAAAAPAGFDFERLFAMPQAIDHTVLAGAYGVPSRRVEALSQLEAALAWALPQPMALLELRTDRRADAVWRRQLRRRMAQLSAES